MLTGKKIGSAKFYLWDRKKYVLIVIHERLVNVRFEGKRPIYTLKNGRTDVLIVQAIHEKKAASKLLTILMQIQNEKNTNN